MRARMAVACLLLLFPVLLPGCGQNNQGAAPGLKEDLDGVKSAVQAVQNKVGPVDNLVREVEALKSSSESEKEAQRRLKSAVDEALSRLTSDVAALKQADKDRYKASLDLKSRVYIPVATRAGFFFMVVDTVDPLQDGSRVGLFVGNPLAAAVKGFKLKAEWGTKPPGAGANASPEAAAQAYEQWEKGLTRKEFAFDDRLESGKWNRITCDLGKFVPRDLGYLGVTLEPVEIVLQR